MRRIAVVQDVALPDGRALRARVWPGGGGALVLLHGLFDDSEGWLALARGTRRPCIALDLPGFGGSGLPVASCLDAYADDVAAGLDALGLDACTLVGHSLGGAVAAHVAERSSAVRSLCLLAPAGFGRIPLADLVARRGVLDLAQLALPLGLVNPSR
jgi:pyruvate dehydrogenase E2 component (dihydrolipoamide acetyltransferase)